MATAVCKPSDSRAWRDFYQAAILEPNLNKLPERILEAETALAMRARELFYSVADDAQEGENLEAAMSILRVLRSSLKRRPMAIQRVSDFDSRKAV